MLIPIPIANALAPKTSPKSISNSSQPSPETLHNDNIRTYTLRTAIKSLIRLRLLVLRFHNVVSTDRRSGARPIARRSNYVRTYVRAYVRTYVNPTAHHIDHDDAHYVDHPTRPMQTTIPHDSSDGLFDFFQIPSLPSSWPPVHECRNGRLIRGTISNVISANAPNPQHPKTHENVHFLKEIHTFGLF